MEIEREAYSQAIRSDYSDPTCRSGRVVYRRTRRPALPSRQIFNTSEINDCINQKGWSDSSLFSKLYPQLCEISHRQLRRGWRGETLETRELVSELYLRLLRFNLPYIQNRAHFFALCARTTRRILIDRVRHMQSIINGGGIKFVSIHESIKAVECAFDDLLRLDQAMKRLRRYDSWLHLVVSIHLYLEMTISETAEVLEVSESKVKSDYRFARAWLKNELS